MLLLKQLALAVKPAQREQLSMVAIYKRPGVRLYRNGKRVFGTVATCCCGPPSVNPTFCCCTNISTTLNPTLSININYGSGSINATLTAGSTDPNCPQGGGSWTAQSFSIFGPGYQSILNFLQIRYVTFKCVEVFNGVSGYQLILNQNGCSRTFNVYPTSGTCDPLNVVYNIHLVDDLGSYCAVTGIHDYTITITP